MKKSTLTLIMLGIITNVFSQTVLKWSKNFETRIPMYYFDSPYIQANNDTIKIIGRDNSAGSQRLLVIKYDLNGDTLSTIKYGKDSVYKNIIIDYKQDGAGNFYILQREQLEFYKSKIVIQKYAYNGSLLWVEQIQNKADTSFTPHSLALINDTCFFFTAYKEYNYPEPGDDVIGTISLPFIYAYHTNGGKLWEREFNQNNETNSLYFSIIIPYKNKALLFGKNSITYNSLMFIEPNKTITTINNIELEFSPGNVLFTPDNNLLISSFHQYRISKIDLSGKKVWSTFYGTNLPSNVSGDEIIALIQDSAGNIYVTGRHYGDEYGTENYTNGDVLTLKYDKNGKLLWQNRYEYGLNNFDGGTFLTLKNGFLYVGGHSQRDGKGTDYDYLSLKINALTGITSGTYRYEAPEGGDDVISSLYVFDNGQVALTGLSFKDSTYNLRTQLLSDIITSVSTSENNNQFEIYPNPISSNGLLTIKNEHYKSYCITSVNGQIIENGLLTEKNYNNINLSGVKPGIYLITLKSNQVIITKKLIIK